MLKRISALILCIALIFSLTSCSGKKSIPFAPVSLGMKTDAVIKRMGTPDDRYATNDYDRVLQYNRKSFLDYTGTVRLCFNDDKMIEAIFVIDGYSYSKERDFVDWTKKRFGEPGFENGVGKVWYNKGYNVHITSFSMGYGSIIFGYTLV